MIIENVQVTERQGRNRDVHFRGGDIRSSDEISVMEIERRDIII